MNVSGLFQLEKPAKSHGGDRYKGKISNDDHEEDSTIYVPQYISRNGSRIPVRSMAMIITTGITGDAGEGGISALCTLKKIAKAKGGDRYDGTVGLDQEAVCMYIPQCFTRSNARSRPAPTVAIIFYPSATAAPKALTGRSSSSSNTVSTPSSSSAGKGVFPSSSTSATGKGVPSSSAVGKGLPSSCASPSPGRLIGSSLSSSSSRVGTPSSSSSVAPSSSGKRVESTPDLSTTLLGCKVESEKMKRRRLYVIDDDDDDNDAAVTFVKHLSSKFERDPLYEPEDPSYEKHFEAYLHKKDDDSIIQEISDADGNFDLQTYFNVKMAKETEQKHSAT